MRILFALVLASCGGIFSDADGPSPMRCTPGRCEGQQCMPGGVCEPFGARAADAGADR